MKSPTDNQVWTAMMKRMPNQDVSSTFTQKTAFTWISSQAPMIAAARDSPIIVWTA